MKGNKGKERKWGTGGAKTCSLAPASLLNVAAKKITKNKSHGVFLVDSASPGCPTTALSSDQRHRDMLLLPLIAAPFLLFFCSCSGSHSEPAGWIAAIMYAASDLIGT